MPGNRPFTGTRSSGSSTARIARELRKIELRKGGKLPLTGAERYKLILKRRMQEQQQKSSNMSAYNIHMLGKGQKGDAKMSKRAEMALKEIARKKAAKEAKELRQMVVIRPRRFGDVGQINAKGVVYDRVNNITLKVDVKTGKIKTMSGWTVGKYKSKGGASQDFWMQTWIKKYSPYYIKLQQMELQRQIQVMQQMQQQGAVNIYGLSVDPHLLQQQIQQLMDQHASLGAQTDLHGNIVGGDGYGHHTNAHGRTNMGVGAWGVMSNNVHGTYAENVWGGFAENTWGTTNNNIWGGIGDSGNLWGRPGRKLWSSGAGGKNYLGIWAGMAMARLGFGGRRARPTGGRMVSAPSMPSGGRGGRR